MYYSLVYYIRHKASIDTTSYPNLVKLVYFKADENTILIGNRGTMISWCHWRPMIIATDIDRNGALNGDPEGVGLPRTVIITIP